jgi:hypothetical protein
MTDMEPVSETLQWFFVFTKKDNGEYPKTE